MDLQGLTWVTQPPRAAAERAGVGVELRSVFRRRTLRPEHVLEPAREMLRSLEQLFAARGAEGAGSMWAEASRRLDEVIEVLKRPSEFYLTVRKRELELEQLAIEQRDRIEAAARSLVRLLPRKPQARVLGRRRA